MPLTVIIPTTESDLPEPWQKSTNCSLAKCESTSISNNAANEASVTTTDTEEVLTDEAGGSELIDKLPSSSVATGS